MNKMLIILVWLILGLFYWWLKTAHFDQCCNHNDQISNTITPNKKFVETPYHFTDNLDSVFVNSSTFSIFYTENFKERKAGDTIQITGWRYRNEPELNDGMELGLFRANKMADLLKNTGVNGPFKLSSVMLGDTDFSDRWYNPDIFTVLEKSIPTIKIANRHLIYHDYGKIDPNLNEETLNYLELVSKKVIASGETIIVTGHTDSKGTTGFNQALSLKRASKVADILLSKGVSSSQIQIKGNGESDPINTSTSDDRHKNNRRTTLEIIK